MSTTLPLMLTNSSKAPLRMVLEPWAWQYKIGPGETIEIVAGEQDQPSIDVDCGDGILTIHGWSFDMKVMIDGEEMEMDFS